MLDQVHHKIAILLLVIPALTSAALADDVRLQDNFALKPEPVYRNGEFAAYEGREFSPFDRVKLFSNDGRLKFQADITMPGATVVGIGGLSPTGKGDLAVSFGVLGSAGRKAYLEWLSPEGKRERIIETTPYAPMALTVDENGRVWTFGHLLDMTPGQPTAAHDTVRIYSAEGQLLHTMLPRDSFGLAPKRNPSEMGHAFSVAGKVGFFSVSALELVLVDTRSFTAERWKVTNPEPFGMVTGAALAGDGQLVVSTQTNGNPGVAGLLRYDTVAGQWAALPAPARADGRAWSGSLLGMDGMQAIVSDSLPATRRVVIAAR